MAHELDISLDVFQTNIQVIYGDIVDLDADIIVSTDDTYLSASSGISKRIREKAGSRTIFHELHKNQIPASVGSIIITSGGNTHFRYIFHAAVLDVRPLKPYKPRDIIMSIVRESLRAALAFNAKKIVVPLLVTYESQLNDNKHRSYVSQLTGMSETRLLDLMLRSILYYITTSIHNTSVREIIVALQIAPQSSATDDEKQLAEDTMRLKREVEKWNANIRTHFNALPGAKLQFLEQLNDDSNEDDLLLALVRKIRSANAHFSNILFGDDASTYNTTNEYSKNVLYEHTKERLLDALLQRDAEIAHSEQELDAAFPLDSTKESPNAQYLKQLYKCRVDSKIALIELEEDNDDIANFDQPQLRDFILNHFDLDEIKTMCQDIGIDYEDIDGTTISIKAMGLVEYGYRHAKLSKILRYCVDNRPNFDWSQFLQKISSEQIRFDQPATEAQFGGAG